jgi:hypothetical protein
MSVGSQLVRLGIGGGEGGAGGVHWHRFGIDAGRVDHRAGLARRAGKALVPRGGQVIHGERRSVR